MKLRYFRQGPLDALRSNIAGNLSNYEKADPWLQEEFPGKAYFLESDIPGDRLPDLKLPAGGELFDLENSKILHKALRGLTREQASSERLWAFLAHEVYWKYMRLRWPVENPAGGRRKNAAGYIREHYFFMPNRHRALVRNGIARLWWYGHLSYDSFRPDKYELTPLLLHTLDIAQSLLERAFSSNEEIAKGVILALEAWNIEKGSPPMRDHFRDAMKHLTRVGGVSILDALDKAEIKDLVLERLERQQKQEVAAGA